jgi:hypothetical protein
MAWRTSRDMPGESLVLRVGGCRAAGMSALPHDGIDRSRDGGSLSFYAQAVDHSIDLASG